MRLITEDIDNKTYLIHLTKEELDSIDYLAMYYEWNNKGHIADEDIKFFANLHDICATVCAHIYSNKRMGWWKMLVFLTGFTLFYVWLYIVLDK